MREVDRGRSADLVIASNRAVSGLRADPDGRATAAKGAGGLVNVLGPALASHEGVWIGCAMTDQDRAQARERRSGERALRVDLPEGPVSVRLLDVAPEDYVAYYQRVATELFWFLQHELLDLVRWPDTAPRLGEADWRSYRRVNEAFAAACDEEAAPGARVLFQDYHLSLAPRQLRARRPDLAISHFTMVPWAEPETVQRLPEALARELIAGLLGADMVCFLVPRWADAFLRTCAAYGYVVHHERSTVEAEGGRPVSVRCFPVGVDADLLRARAAEPDVARDRIELAGLVGDRALVVRVDRMEPSKNILRGLDGFAELLDRHPELHGRVIHFVLAYTSRTGLPAYDQYAEEVERRAKAINSRLGTAAWQPIILETENNFGRGLAAMALADVLVVNPLRDGMNLVAKEGPVVSERDLALVLSTGAGAAWELADGALLVDPLDVSALADAIAAGLAMAPAERAARLARLRGHAGALPPRRWLSEALAELERVRSARGSR
jgi:trehalose 6-phosphate synthase